MPEQTTQLSQVQSLADLSWEPWAIALIGASGTGKTRTAATALGKHFWFDFDQGMMSLAHRPGLAGRIDFNQYRAAPYAGKEAGHDFGLACKKMKELARDCPYDVVVVDSFLSMTECCFEWCKAQMEMGGLPLLPEKGSSFLPIYGALAFRAMQFFHNFLALPCNRILICHETYEMNEVTGAMEFQIDAAGKKLKTGSIISKWFDERWRCRVFPGKEKGQLNYKLQTRGGEGFRATSRWDCFEMFEEPDIEKMLVKVRKKFDTGVTENG